MEVPKNLLYTETHEWVKQDGGRITIGLTDYAQRQLRDIVYVELPEGGIEFKKGDSLAVVESVKTVADVFSPVTGTVAETNAALKDHPQFVNEDPYGKGWILKMDASDPGELEGLLSPDAYQSTIQEEE